MIVGVRLGSRVFGDRARLALALLGAVKLTGCRVPPVQSPPAPADVPRLDRRAAPVAAEVPPRRTEAGNWKRVARPLIAHGGHHTMTVLPSGAVLVIGGQHAKWEQEPAAAEIWDPTRDRWDLVPGIDARPTFHTASLLPDGRVAIAGGTGNGR